MNPVNRSALNRALINKHPIPPLVGVPHASFSCLPQVPLYSGIARRYSRLVVMATIMSGTVGFSQVSHAAVALATAATNAPSSFNNMMVSSWQKPPVVELALPSLQGQGLSFADQYQNKRIGEWSLQKINGQAKMEHDPWIQETIKGMTW